MSDYLNTLPSGKQFYDITLLEVLKKEKKPSPRHSCEREDSEKLTKTLGPRVRKDDGERQKISRLPACLRIILESLLRNQDERIVTNEHIQALVNWQPTAKRSQEIPFRVSRVILQDYTGVPLLVDLAAMRDAAQSAGIDPKKIEPLVPVDLVIDHSVQTNVTRSPDALVQNMTLEFKRNRERYEFLKWGQQAFGAFDVIPPGIGIIHQVNLEHLATGIHEKDNVIYPDTMVGTDSHTTMINGIGAVGWGVGGIEAEAAMLGQPIYMLMPDVIGVHLTGKLAEGATATDLVLCITELLRNTNVVGKFVEFFGEGASHLSVPDRATIANMAPDYGATMGYFGVDQSTLDYFKATGRTNDLLERVKEYYTAQGLFGIPQEEECDYSQVLTLDLSCVSSCVAGPKRPQDRIELADVKTKFADLLTTPLNKTGYGKSIPAFDESQKFKDGDILIAAITSCTNTSNPMVLLTAGLLAKKAVEKGLSVASHIKTSLAPGSRVVTDYLRDADLLDSLEQLGFNIAGYGCTTCIGNVGDLEADIEEYITENDIVAAAVLSGNRNFEARIHPNIRANFLMSPPLVVAYAIAGNMRVDLKSEALGEDKDGNPVYLKDIWPNLAEVKEMMHFAMDPEHYRSRYQHIKEDAPMWQNINTNKGNLFQWDDKSTYIANPPFFNDFELKAKPISDITGARALAILPDSITTDHISPAGSIALDSPAGRYLIEHGVKESDFNSFGARRGNHEVMMRGTFSNGRIKNAMVPGVEGGLTVHKPSGEELSIYDAGMRYISEQTPTIIFAGSEYGTGSSRDWAAKGTRLLGTHAVIAKSFERIHRSNLIGMGVLPCQFQPGEDAQSLNITGNEIFDLTGIEGEIQPGQLLTLVIHHNDGAKKEVQVTARLDTPIEVDYYQNDGILPYMLRQM